MICMLPAPRLPQHLLYWTYSRLVLDIKVAYIAIHYYEIPPHDLLAAGIWGTVTSLIYNPILSMVKVSVLAFLLRFASIQTGVRITIWVLIVFTLGLMVAATLGIVFMCTPIAFNWDPSIKIGSCIDKPRFVLSTSGLGVFTDITTIAIPFYIFLGLRMTRKKKMAILAVFGLGAVYAVPPPNPWIVGSCPVFHHSLTPQQCHRRQHHPAGLVRPSVLHS